MHPAIIQQLAADRIKEMHAKAEDERLARQPQRFKGGARLVTDRVVPVFGGCIWFRWSQRMADGPMCSGAPAPTAPGGLLSRVAGTGWLVRRVLAGRTAAASRSGMPPSRARCG